METALTTKTRGWVKRFCELRMQFCSTTYGPHRLLCPTLLI